MNYKNTNVVITGGAGFIGSHLTEALVYAGANVTVIDNLSTGKLENLKAIKEKINFIQGDIADKDLCLKISTNTSHIFHLAACASVPLSMNDPKLCHNSNVQGLFNMLEAARINGVFRFIFSSSSAIYGDHIKKCSENSTPNPTSTYGYSKLLGEIYCQQYAQLYNVPTLSLRYFNVIGERQNPHDSYAGVYAKFMYNMKHNLPITIYGDGTQTRDFITVENVVKANMKLAQLPTTLCDGKPINIGTGIPTTINDLFIAVKKLYPLYQLDPLYSSERAGDIKFSTADCKLYRTLEELLL